MKAHYIFLVCAFTIFGSGKGLPQGEIESFIWANHGEDESFELADDFDEHSEVSVCGRTDGNASNEIGDSEKFFVEMTLPETIRYKEKIRVDVKIHNYIETEEALKVFVKINNLNDVFRFFDTACSKTPSNDTKVVTVPHMSTQNVSFFIQLSKNGDIKLTANAQSENEETSQCEITKRLKVEPIEVHSFDRGETILNVYSAWKYGIIKELAKNEKVSKFSFEIIGENSIDFQSEFLPANFTVTITNEHDFRKIVNITSPNQENPVEVVLPIDTLHPQLDIQAGGK